EELGILRVLANSAISEIELRRRAEDLRRLSSSLQTLVDARTAQLRASEERQRVLLEVNNAIVTCLDRDSLFAATAAALRRVIPYDRAALVLHDAGRDVFRVLGVAGPVPTPSAIPLGTEWSRAGSRAGWVLDHRRPLLTGDLREAEPFVEHAPLMREGILS